VFPLVVRLATVTGLRSFGELLSLPDLTEQDVIGEVHDGGCEVAEHLLSARGWLFPVV
jgi:hypothetical protein